jgi:hypothetical protein
VCSALAIYIWLLDGIQANYFERSAACLKRRMLFLIVMLRAELKEALLEKEAKQKVSAFN